MQLTKIKHKIGSVWNRLLGRTPSFSVDSGKSSDGFGYYQISLPSGAPVFRARIYDDGSLQLFTSGSIRIESLGETQMNASILHFNNDLLSGCGRENLAAAKITERILDDPAPPCPICSGVRSLPDSIVGANKCVQQLE